MSYSQSEDQFQAIHPNAAGINIGADRHWVSVPAAQDQQAINALLLYAITA